MNKSSLAYSITEKLKISKIRSQLIKEDVEDEFAEIKNLDQNNASNYKKKEK